jgi:hypothetical protein
MATKPYIDFPGTLFDWPGQPAFGVAKSTFTTTPLIGEASQFAVPLVEFPSQYSVPILGFLTTLQDDCWDLLSRRAYGSEFFGNVLQEANPLFNQISIFDGGMLIIVPVIDQAQSLDLPPWKIGATLVNG